MSPGGNSGDNIYVCMMTSRAQNLTIECTVLYIHLVEGGDTRERYGPIPI